MTFWMLKIKHLTFTLVSNVTNKLFFFLLARPPGEQKSQSPVLRYGCSPSSSPLGFSTIGFAFSSNNDFKIISRSYPDDLTIFLASSILLPTHFSATTKFLSSSWYLE